MDDKTNLDDSDLARIRIICSRFPEELEADGRFSASPHHGFRGWMALELGGDVDWSEIDELLQTAYVKVAGKELVAELNRDSADDQQRDGD